MLIGFQEGTLFEGNAAVKDMLEREDTSDEEKRLYIIAKALGDTLQVDSIRPNRDPELKWKTLDGGDPHLTATVLHTEDRLNLARAI